MLFLSSVDPTSASTQMTAQTFTYKVYIFQFYAPPCRLYDDGQWTCVDRSTIHKSNLKRLLLPILRVVNAAQNLQKKIG